MGLLRVALIGLMVLAGCSTIHQKQSAELPLAETWVVIPFVNNTETPYAAERAESIATALLYARGISTVLQAPQLPTADGDFAGQDRGLKRRQEGLAWAKKQAARYALQGTVNEWRYKVGLDGEPVAGITLQVIDLQSGSVVWSGSAAKSGWSREAVSAVAQQLMETLLAGVRLR